MQKGLNFRTLASQAEYFAAYEKSLGLIAVPFVEKHVPTSFGQSHIICCGNEQNPPLVLLHAASCGSPIWYKNLPYLSARYCVYAVDLIGESSASILTAKMKTPADNAAWLNETLTGLGLSAVLLCGLSIGGWNAANYAATYPAKVRKLILLSPVQTFAKMHLTYFFRIMKMGFKPTRQNIERYIGWGSEKEAPLPDSIIEQFKISVMNINGNASFPRYLQKRHLQNLQMPTLVMFGEREFAFSVRKAVKRAGTLITDLQLEIVDDASHLLPLGRTEYINERINEFLVCTIADR